MLVWVAVVVACGYASVASMLASVAMVFVLWYGLFKEGLLCGTILALIVIYRHRENLERLRHGTENRLSLLKANRQL